MQPMEHSDHRGPDHAGLWGWLTTLFKVAFCRQPSRGHPDRRRKVGDTLGWWCNVLSIPVLGWGAFYVRADDSAYMGSVLKVFGGLVSVLPTSGACLVLGISALVLTQGRTRRSKIVLLLSVLHLLLLTWTVVYIVRT